jgi:hypothetical protein
MKTKTKTLPARNGKRAAGNGTNGAARDVDTNRRYTKKELEAMTKEEVTLLAYRMTYDRVHGKRKVRD